MVTSVAQKLAGEVMITELITLPRVIPLFSIMGIYHICMKNKRGFVYHAIAAILWSGYDLSIGATEQGLYVFSGVFFAIIGYWKWDKDEKKGVKP